LAGFLGFDMSTAWVECWKCDECGFRWIKTEVWPERCASSKCRKRSWNKNAGVAQTVRALDPTEEGKTSPAVREVTSSIPVPAPKPDMAALRAICAGDFISDRAGHYIAPGIFEVTEASAKDMADWQRIAELVGCPHHEWAEDGEQYRCRLQAGHKGKCAAGERVT
jgi:hypothetical protein